MKPRKPKNTKPKSQPVAPVVAETSPDPDAEPTEPATVPDHPIIVETPVLTARDKEKEAFTNWYLRTLTTQYANDLDKLRTAPDFRGDKASVEVLRTALKCGVGIFYDEEA